MSKVFSEADQRFMREALALVPHRGRDHGEAGEAEADLADPLDHRQRHRRLGRHAERAADQHQRRLERVAAEVEEVVVDADAVDLQEITEDLRQAFFVLNESHLPQGRQVSSVVIKISIAEGKAELEAAGVLVPGATSSSQLPSIRRRRGALARFLATRE